MSFFIVLLKAPRSLGRALIIVVDLWASEEDTHVSPVDLHQLLVCSEATVFNRALQTHRALMRRCTSEGRLHINELQWLTFTCWEMCSSYLSWVLKPRSHESQKWLNSGSFCCFCSNTRIKPHHTGLQINQWNTDEDQCLHLPFYPSDAALNPASREDEDEDNDEDDLREITWGQTEKWL